MSESKKEGLALLREPFPEHQISKLPKPTKKENPPGKCLPKSQGGDAPNGQDHFCGGWHRLPAIHLDYVGHAALTDRLLDADMNWTWEPLAYDAAGLPKLDETGGMWIRLVVCGMARLGYGDAQGKTGGDAVKERIGDALRNAAMRFGAALDLWHKGDLHGEEEKETTPFKPSIVTHEVVSKGVIKPTDGAWDGMSPEAAARIRKLANRVLDGFVAGDTKLAYAAYLDAKEEIADDLEAKLAIWTLFDSKQRRVLKEMDAAGVQAKIGVQV